MGLNDRKDDRDIQKNQQFFRNYTRNLNTDINEIRKNTADQDETNQMKKVNKKFTTNFNKFINNVGKKNKDIDIEKHSTISNKGISKHSGLITDDDDISDDSFSVARSKEDTQREYASKNILAIRSTGKEQTKALLGGMGAMNEVAMKMHSKYYRANLAMSNKILMAMNKSNEFRYTVQANYYKTSIDYKKSTLNELRAIHATLRTGFGINSKGQIAEDRMTESMARVMFGEDWKKGLKGGFLNAFNRYTGGAGGFISMGKDLLTGTIDQLLRDGNFLKKIGQMGISTVMAGALGKGNAKKAQDFFSNPAAFVETFFDRLKDSQNQLLSALGYGFGTRKEKFGSFSGLSAQQNNDMTKRQIFDKAAHFAITRIIPYHLSRIDAKLTKTKALTYDYEKNRFMTYEESQKMDKEFREKADVKKYSKNIDTNAKNLIDTILDSKREDSIKKLLEKMPEEKRRSVVISMAGVIKGLAMDGEILNAQTGSLRISKDTILKYLPNLKKQRSEDKETQNQKDLELTVLYNLFQYSANNFVEDFETLMNEANDLKDAIAKDVEYNAKRSANSASFFLDSTQAYSSVKSKKRFELNKLTEKQKEELARFDVDITAEKIELKESLAKHKIDIKYEESLDYVKYLYEKDTDPIVVSMLKSQIENIDGYMKEMIDAGADEDHPKYKGFQKMKEALQEQLKKQKSDRKPTTKEDLDDYADKGFKTNRFGGAKLNSLDPKDVKANAELFLNSEAGDKVSKGIQWGAVAGLSALIAKKGGFGKWGAPIAGAMVASAVTARGRLNKMVRIGLTSEGDELMEDGRTKREALMHNLVKDLLPAGFGVATGVKVSNFIKNSVNFGGIIGPVVGFGVGSAIFAISRLGWIKKLAGLFFKPFKAVGKYIDQKFFKGIFTDTFGGIKSMFMGSIGTKLGLDKKRLKYDDILNKPGTGIKKGEVKKKDNDKDDTTPNNVAGSDSTKKLRGTTAGTCAPLVMARLSEYFYGSKVKDETFDEAAKEYVNKHKDGVTMQFFVDMLTESGEFSVQLYKGSNPPVWRAVENKKIAIIGHRTYLGLSMDVKQIQKQNSPLRSNIFSDKPSASSSLGSTYSFKNRKETGHFLFYSEVKGKNDIMEYDPLTGKATAVSLVGAAMRCDVFLVVKYVGNGGKGSKIANSALENFVSVTKANAKAVSSNNASSSYMHTEGQKRLREMKANAMNVNIVGGHLDAVGVIGAIDAEAYRSKMKELTVKPLSKEMTKRAQYQKDFFQRDNKAKGMLKEQNLQEIREKENTENLEALAKEAKGDKKDKKEDKKKGFLSKIAGFLPFLAGAIGPFVASFLKDGWRKSIAKLAITMFKPIGKGAGKGLKWLWGKATGHFKSKARDKIKDAAVETFEKGAKKGGEEAAEDAAETLVKQTVQEGGEKAAKEISEETAEGVAKSMAKKGAEEGSEGLLKKTLQGLTKHFDDLAAKADKLPFIGKFLKNGLGKSIIEFIKNLMPKFGKEVAEDAIEQGAKSVAKEGAEEVIKEGTKAGIKGASSAVVGVGTAITLAFATWDTIQAWRHAHETFGVKPNECNVGMKTSAAIFAGVMGTLELIPFASWVLMPINIFYKKKIVAMIYEAFFIPKDKSKGKWDNQNVNMDLNGDGEVTSAEQEKVMAAIKKRKEVDERNGHKVAQRMIKQLRNKVKGVQKIPLIGRLIKKVSDTLNIDKVIDDICKRIEEKTVTLFVQLGTQGARKEIQNKKMGKAFNSITKMNLGFSSIFVMKAVWDNLRRADEIMKVKPDEVNNWMRIAISNTYFVLETASCLPGMSYIIDPIKELYGDDICRSVYNNVLIPVMDAANAAYNTLEGIVDLNGDGVIDEKDLEVAVKKTKEMASEFVSQVKETIGKAAEAFVKFCDKYAKALWNPIGAAIRWVRDKIKGGYQALSGWINEEFSKMAEDAFKDMKPEDLKKAMQKPVWMKAGRQIFRGVTMGLGPLTADFIKHNLGASVIFETDQIDAAMRTSIAVTCIILNVVENFLNTVRLGGWASILQDVMFDTICRKVYNKWFGGDLFDDLEEYDNSGEVKFDKDGNVITNKKDKKAKLNSTIDENKGKAEDSEDVKNKKEQIKNEFKEKAAALFGKVGLSGGWFSGDGTAVEIAADKLAEQNTTNTTNAPITTASSPTDIVNAVSDASTSSNTKSSGGNNSGFSSSERDIINKVYGATVSDGVLATIAKYRKEHPAGWKTQWELMGKKDEASQKEAKKRLENIVHSNMASIEKAQGTKGIRPNEAKGPGRSRGIMQKVSYGGKGSGGKYPFYSQNSFLSTHNIGSETGSEAGCALAVAKMIIKFKNIKMNDMQLYQATRPYITKNNAIDIDFFNVIGGTYSNNIMDVKTSIATSGSALALLVNKGYNHFVAIINDNGRLLLGDPEGSGWEPIDINHVYLNSFGAASVFSDSSMMYGSLEGKGRGRLNLAGRGPEMKNIGFGNGGNTPSSSGGISGNNIMGSQQKAEQHSAYSGSLYDVDVKQTLGVGGAPSGEQPSNVTPTAGGLSFSPAQVKDSGGWSWNSLPQVSGKGYTAMKPLVDALSGKFGIPADVITASMYLESSMNPNAKTGSYTGLGQLNAESWNGTLRDTLGGLKYNGAAYGVPAIGAGGVLTDPRQNATLFTARMAHDARVFQKNGAKEVTAGMLHLSHMLPTSMNYIGGADIPVDKMKGMRRSFIDSNSYSLTTTGKPGAPAAMLSHTLNVENQKMSSKLQEAKSGKGPGRRSKADQDRLKAFAQGNMSNSKGISNLDKQNLVKASLGNISMVGKGTGTAQPTTTNTPTAQNTNTTNNIPSINGGIPPWFTIAEQELSKNITETGNRAVVSEYCKAGGVAYGQPWCACFVTWCLKKAGVDTPTNASSQFYRSSSAFKKLDKPVKGCIAVLTNNGGKGDRADGAVHGHVTFYVEGDEKKFTGLGGNQGTVGGGGVTKSNGYPGGKTFSGWYWPVNAPDPSSQPNTTTDSLGVTTKASLTLKNAMTGGWFDASGKKIDLESLVANSIANKFGGNNGNTQNTNTTQNNTITTSTSDTSGLQIPSDDGSYPVVQAIQVPSNHKASIAADYIVKHASSKSQHKCAAFVSNGLIKAGFSITKQESAYQYHSNGVLTKAGFIRISAKSPWQKGDIFVFNKTAGHEHGHIAMYDGIGWYSDFKQNGPAPGYKSDCYLYRCMDIANGAGKSSGSQGKGDVNPNKFGSFNKNLSIGLNSSAKSAMKSFGSNSSATFSNSNLIGPTSASSTNMYSGVNSQLRAIGMTGNKRNVTTGPTSNLEALLQEQNNLMTQLLNQNNTAINLNKQQLDVQIETAKTNEIISKKDWKNNNITNINSGTDPNNVASDFSELKSTMERWKSEKIGVNTVSSVASPNTKVKK